MSLGSLTPSTQPTFSHQSPKKSHCSASVLILYCELDILIPLLLHTHTNRGKRDYTLPATSILLLQPFTSRTYEVSQTEPPTSTTAVVSPANDLKTTSTEMSSPAEEYHQTQNTYIHAFGSLLVYLLSYAITAILGLISELTGFILEVAIPVGGCILLVWLWYFHPSGPWQRINAVGDRESIGPWLRLGAFEARRRCLLARDRIYYPFRILYAALMQSLAVAQAEPLGSQYELTSLYV